MDVRVIVQAALDETCATCGKFVGNHGWEGTLASGKPVCPVYDSEGQVDFDLLRAQADATTRRAD